MTTAAELEEQHQRQAREAAAAAAWQAAACKEWCYNVARFLALGGNTGRIITPTLDGWLNWQRMRLARNVFGVVLEQCSYCSDWTLGYGPAAEPKVYCITCWSAYIEAYPKPRKGPYLASPTA